jgi:hypothetical protein
MTSKMWKIVAQKICSTSVIFKKLPKVNDRPIGENSPNLVTLFLGQLYDFKNIFAGKWHFSLEIQQIGQNIKS